MKRFVNLFILLLITANVLSTQSVAAGNALKVTGGGTGTFGADLDGDGDVDGSQFGLGVIVQGDGSAKGHFECLMAGRSDILGLHLMSVAGQVANGSVSDDKSVTFSGVGSVNLGDGVIIRGVPFLVRVTEGGAGIGTLQLTVMGAFDGVPGDAVIGNGNYDLPVENVSNGQIEIH